MSPSRPTAPAWVLLTLTALTGVATLLSVLVGGEAETLGAWWPVPGLVAVTLLLAVRREALTALGLLAVLVLAGLLGGRDPVPAVALAATDVAAALVAVVVLTRLHLDGGTGPRRLDRLADAASLLVAGAAGAVVGGTGVALTLSRTDGRGLGEVLTMAGLAHAAGLLVLMPLALVAWRLPRPAPGGSLAHAALTGVVVVAAFGPWTAGLTGLALLVLPLPLMVWAAARLDLRVVCAELVGLATLVSLTVLASPTTFGAGAAGRQTTTQVAQVYLVTLVLLVLPLALALREREEADRRTRESERLFRRAFTQSGLPVLLCRWDGETLRVSSTSDACVGLLGERSDDLVGTDLATLVSAPALWETLGAGPLRDFPGWVGRIRLLRSEQRAVEAYCSLLELDGARGLVSLHLVDLTEHLDLQQSLQDERTWSQAVMDTAASMIVVTDTDGTILSTNPETTRLTGFRREELVGRGLAEALIAARGQQVVADAVARLLPLPRTGEVRVRTSTGEERTVVFSHATHQGSPGAAPTYVFSGTDVTEARESAGLVEHLLRSVVGLGFVGTDTAGRVTLFSTGAERLFGIRVDQALGRPAGSLLRDPDLPDEPDLDGEVPLARLVGHGGAEGSPRTRDWLAVREGRDPVRVSLTCNPVRAHDGTVTSYLFVARDVSETRRNQEIMVSALRREREVVTRLQELDRAKDDFISTVSHELRTPMTSIIGSAEMLADGMVGDLEEAQEQLVGVITRNGARLLGLADDLLALASFDRGAVPGPTLPLDLRDVVAESVATVRPQAGARHLSWHVDVPEEPVRVVGEASHLERALTNLLTNAAKFTPGGGSVSVTLERGTSVARLVVADTGRGIVEADLEHVFDRFYRAAEVQEHAIQGTGLGLAIVKQIVERHEGTVAVASRHGEGTTFTLALPVLDPARPV